PDARQQLGEGERLHQVVVGAGVEAGDAIVDRIARGEQQDRRGHAAPAQLAEQREAVELGEQDGEPDDGVACGPRVVAPFAAIARHVDGVARLRKSLAKRTGNAAFVLDDQQPHAVTPGGGVAASVCRPREKASFSSFSHRTLVASSDLAVTVAGTARRAAMKRLIITVTAIVLAGLSLGGVMAAETGQLGPVLNPPCALPDGPLREP